MLVLHGVVCDGAGQGAWHLPLHACKACDKASDLLLKEPCLKSADFVDDSSGSQQGGSPGLHFIWLLKVDMVAKIQLVLLMGHCSYDWLL